MPFETPVPPNSRSVEALRIVRCFEKSAHCCCQRNARRYAVTALKVPAKSQKLQNTSRPFSLLFPILIRSPQLPTTKRASTATALLFAPTSLQERDGEHHHLFVRISEQVPILCAFNATRFTRARDNNIFRLVPTAGLGKGSCGRNGVLKYSFGRAEFFLPRE